MYIKDKKPFACFSINPAILVVVILLIAFAFIMLQSRGILVNYWGWETADVPTDTTTKATVKLPKDWRFVTEDGRIYIKDDNDNVVAGELYEAWGRYQDISETSPNELYLDILNDYTDKEIVCANIDVCTVTKYSYESSEEVYILTIPVYFSTENRCHYELTMVIENEFFDDKTFLKLVESYREPSDYIQ